MYVSSILSLTSNVPMGSLTSTSTFSGNVISSTLPLMTLILEPRTGLVFTNRSAYRANSDASTAYTTRAPACAAKKESIPEPHPTSMTAFPRKSLAFSVSAA